MAKSRAVQDMEAYSAGRKATAGAETVEHTAERTIAGVTETVRYWTKTSADGKWIRVEQKEYAPMFSWRAWPITPQKMDAVARQIDPRARVADDTLFQGTGTFFQHVRTYRVAD